MGGVGEVMLPTKLDIGYFGTRFRARPPKFPNFIAFALAGPVRLIRTVVFPVRVHPRRRDIVLCTAGALALASCATVPLPAVRTVQVLTPVPTPCIAAADVPARPAPLPATRPADDRDAVRVLMAKLLEWGGPGGYGDKVAAIMPRCVAVDRTPATP